MSAVTPPNSRIRQIAILVSSVDTATARQLLLHLPTETARRVRSLAAELGPITPEEKRKILSEFQKSARGEAGSEAHQQGAASQRGQAKPTEGEFAAIQRQATTVHSSGSDAAPTPAASNSQVAAWTRLSTEALVRFVHGERPAVIAVVASQLAPEVAVQVLQHLPHAVNHDVLTRLSRLQEIDTEAMQAIDSYLSERLVEYQHTLESEGENRRRIQALLAAAPIALREQWESVFAPQTTPDHAAPNAPSQDAQTVAAQATIAERSATLQSDVTAAEQSATHVEDRSQEPDLAALAQATAGENEALDSIAEILPFPGTAETRNSEEFDQSLAQLEFEQILELPASQLANLLSMSQAETVLLALAGATPQFMHRFYGLLRAQDANVLRERLQQLGTIQLRDIDEAQRKIVELSLRLNHPSTAHPPSATRQVA